MYKFNIVIWVIMSILLTGTTLTYFFVLSPKIGSNIISQSDTKYYENDIIEIQLITPMSAYTISKVGYTRVSKDTIVIKGRLRLMTSKSIVGFGYRMNIYISINDEIQYIRLDTNHGEIIWNRNH